MPQLVYTMDEFRAMHGGNALFHSGGELLPDGARITSMGGFIEPPTDPSALLQLKRLYVDEMLRLEEDAYKSQKDDWAAMLANKIKYANPLPGPPADWKQQLERKAERIAKLRKERDAFVREIAALPGQVANRAYQEQRRQQQQAAREQLSEIANLQI